MGRRTWLAWIIGVFLLPVGCGPSGPATYPVSGTVTLDGKPIPDGDVILNGLDPVVSADAGKIKDGKFQFRAKAGKKTVFLQATRRVAEAKGPMGDAVYEDYIPAEYNTASTLTVEVKSDGPNEWEFKLVSKKK
jgi:hypothetical protein